MFTKTLKNILGTYIHVLHLKLSKKKLLLINNKLEDQKYTFFHGQKLKNAVVI